MSPARRPKRVGPPTVDDLGTVHRPIDLEPLRYRPDGTDADRGYYGPSDPAGDQNLWSDPPETAEHWRDRDRGTALAVLVEALHGLEVTAYELRQLKWLTHGERSETVVVASLLDRAYRAGLAHGKDQK